MSARARLPNQLLFVLIGMAITRRGDAQLAAVSPFVPVQAAAAAGPTAGASLEFRGIADTAGGVKFRVVDPSKKSGAWLALDERDPEHGFIVKQYDGANDTLTVEFQGRALTLALHEAKVTSGGAAPPLPLVQIITPPPPASGIPLTSNLSVSGNPGALDAVAADVARRRALREQAAPQVGPAISPAPVIPPPNQIGQRGGRGGRQP